MSESKIEMIALQGKNFDVDTYRGYARLSDLARISTPDTYDETNNPQGIQRDLDKRHAKEAYLYAATGEGKLGSYRLWPEIVLNVRDPSVVSKEVVGKVEGYNLVKLTFDPDKIDKDAPRPQVSRVDGNHRLFFAEGDPAENQAPADGFSPFSLTIGLPVIEEQSLFKDINDNQKGMNTSHLDNIVYRVKDRSLIQETEPELWIAQKLHEDPDSPFHGVVYRGGIRTQGMQRLINLRSLKNGVKLLLSNSHELPAMPGPSVSKVPAQYIVIRNYWNAVKRVFSSDWNKSTLLLKGVGYRALSIAGAYIIDKCVAVGTTDTSDMEVLVQRTKKTKFDGHSLNWDRDGPVRAYGGMKGVGLLAQTIIAAIAAIDEGMVKRLAGEVTRS